MCLHHFSPVRTRFRTTPQTTSVQRLQETALLLGWPKSSFGFFHTMLQKNSFEQTVWPIHQKAPWCKRHVGGVGIKFEEEERPNVKLPFFESFQTGLQSRLCAYNVEYIPQFLLIRYQNCLYMCLSSPVWFLFSRDSKLILFCNPR